ncbi:hypothetical protein [Paenochrobactrum glaciei]|uniref:Uncharacterized protein n=1 Tax=Paenochrobactrum glaciei TaxID=486407 RepID=A0ABN1GK90_9HYPH
MKAIRTHLLKAALPAVITLSLPTTGHAQSLCQQISGANIVAQDGTFLGNVSSQFDSKSVLNEFGTHGSEFSGQSIWNEFGSYGGKFSDKSPFNEFSSTPPMIIKNGRVIGYLSVQRASNTLNPYILKTCKDEIF